MTHPMRLIPLLLLLPLASAIAQDPQLPASDSVAAARTPPQREVRRQQVTDDLERTAFADQRARELLHRARAARTAQDSALRNYRALSIQRLSVGLGIRGTFDRMLFRGESSSRIGWSRESGVWIAPTGRRAAAPMFSDGEASMDLQSLTSIPYFPGREALWIPSSTMGVTQVEVNEEEMLHPLAVGAEAYYRYAVGDSMVFRLPDGRTIALRELRIAARRPQWRAFVGSFWFDTERGNLVRAAYRMAAEMDIWEVAGDEARREAEEAIDQAKKDGGPPLLARIIINPMKANLSAVTIEYGLYEGRFWLPKLQVAEGHVEVSFARAPVKWEESFRYEAVNGDFDLPPVPRPQDIGLAPSDTNAGGHIVIGSDSRDLSPEARRAREDSLITRYNHVADSLRALAAAARERGDSTAANRLSARADRNEGLSRRIAFRRESCERDSTYIAGVTSQYGGVVRTVTVAPCDHSVLQNSPDLPHPLFDPAERVFGTADRDELLRSLDLSLQPGWGPQPPVIRTGLDLLRYNRIEGLSPGVEVSSVLGRGYTARAEARIGTGDWVPNGELSLSRSNGRSTLTFGAFHRLGVANDAWGTPLSFGASASNLAYGRDEGFYYRTFGGELRALGEVPGPLGARMEWRLFVERQRSAGVDPNTQFTIARAFGRTSFGENIDATQLTAVGAGGTLTRTFGANPFSYRLFTQARAELAVTDRSDALGNTGYGRGMVEASFSRLFGRLGASLTGAAGSSAGDVPIQRAFYVGGLQTVRGQFARADTTSGHAGDSFWLVRSELGLNYMVARPVIFYDVGWAGPRNSFTSPGRPLSGAGAGISILDGLLRLDLSRGLWPEKRWRADLSLGARF